MLLVLRLLKAELHCIIVLLRLLEALLGLLAFLEQLCDLWRPKSKDRYDSTGTVSSCPKCTHFLSGEGSMETIKTEWKGSISMLMHMIKQNCTAKN